MIEADTIACPNCDARINISTIPRPTQRTIPTQTSTIPKDEYPITCSICGKPATVPFKPREGSFVQCRDCYNARRRG